MFELKHPQTPLALWKQYCVLQLSRLPAFLADPVMWSDA